MIDTLTGETCLGCHEYIKKALLCPVCQKNKKRAVFCSQECFKQNWSRHKELHASIECLINRNEKSLSLSLGQESLKLGYSSEDVSTWNLDVDLAPFTKYKFTGKLRPWPRTQMRLSIPDSIKAPDYYKTFEPAQENLARWNNRIVVRKPEEVEEIRKACHLARLALDMAHTLVKPGITTEEIDDAVYQFIIDHEAYPSPLHYRGFPKACCISVNEVVCHGIPDLRPLQNGDIVNIDITVFYRGMHGDLNETYICGTSEDPEASRLISVAYESLMHAIAKCSPGFLYRDIGSVISNVAEKQKLSVVKTFCGHGIGTLFHTAPTVPHYRNNKAIGIMKKGHVFTIEPMINEGTWKEVSWPDGWTIVTADGKRSAQFEHTLVVTDKGVEVLTARLPTSPSLDIDVPEELEFYLNKNNSVEHNQ